VARSWPIQPFRQSSADLIVLSISASPPIGGEMIVTE
jgi:hypothetical protein